MKAKEIISKLKIQNGVSNKRQQEFFNTMIGELEENYQSFGQKDSERHFDAAVKILRSKWDAISKSVKYGLSEGMWRYFYATQIIPKKKELCPSWAERKEREHQMYEERKQRRMEKELKRREEYFEE